MQGAGETIRQILVFPAKLKGGKTMKRTVFRKMAAVFISLMLTVAMAVPARAEDLLEESSGSAEVGLAPGVDFPSDHLQCGESSSYSFDNASGVLTVSGSGTTWNYYSGFYVTGDIYTIKIDSGITALGDVFLTDFGHDYLREDTELVNIILPKSLKKIGEYNFNTNNRAEYIFYEGTASDWNKIAIDSTNSFSGRRILFKGEWFKDVSRGKDFFFKPVYWAVMSGITGGYGEGTFQPYFPCTRAMIVTFLYRRAGSPDVPGTNQFSDVKPTDWYYKSVSWAVKEGITTGYGAGTFQPDAPCTRAMIVTFLMRRYGPYAPYYEPVYKKIFPDVPKGAWYTDAVMWAYDMGVTTGRGGYFKPNDVCTRGEAVSFISRTIE